MGSQVGDRAFGFITDDVRQALARLGRFWRSGLDSWMVWGCIGCSGEKGGGLHGQQVGLERVSTVETLIANCKGGHYNGGVKKRY